MHSPVIFYGLSGEGLGHASRTLAVIDQLPDYKIHVFTFGKAYDYFAQLKYPYLHRIDGLMFSYKGSKVDYLRTNLNAAGFFLKLLRNNINYIKKQANLLKPDLFIADFEPSIPRAAKICGKKLISIDNQHRFAYTDLIELPLFLRAYGWCCGIVAKFLVPNPDYTVISTFHYDHIKPRGKNVITTNGLLRKDLAAIKPSKKGFTLVYVRDSVTSTVLSKIAGFKNHKFKIYGAPLGKYVLGDNFTFHKLSNEFIQDLADCDYLISTAGNQLIGEARFYQKPCLVIPEPGQYEQSINAYYTEKIGIGMKCELRKLTSDVIEKFINSFQTKPSRVPNGVNTAADLIRQVINGKN